MSLHNILKKYLTLCILTIIIFTVLTILTAKIQIPSDGNDSYGFPFEFYKIYGGKRDYYPPNEFSIIKMTIDIIVAGFISSFIILVFKKVRQRLNNVAQ
jgi:hypothetical protein